jgi:hypothetical protein
MTTPAPTPSAEPAPAIGTLADGRHRQLDPAYVPAQRTARWIFVAIVTAGMGLSALVTLLSTGVLAAATVLGGGGVLLALLVWWAHFWPPIAYRHASYALGEDGLEIRRGVVWRAIVNVPRSRVQHTDVSQGPIERSYALGSLSIHTAGTDHALVSLPGLAHTTALRIRDHLLPAGEEDAV